MATRSGGLYGALSLAIACGGTTKTVEQASQQPEPMGPQAAVDAPKPSHLAIVPMTITSGPDSIRISGEGDIETPAQREPVARLRPTGEVFHPNGGLYLTLNSDGTLTGAHLQLGDLSDVVIDDDGNVAKNGQPLLAISEDGTIMRGTEAVAQISGPVEGRRAAMLVFLLASLEASSGPPGGAPPDGASSDGGEAPEEPPPPSEP